MIIRVHILPPGAIPIADGPLPLRMTPDVYARAAAERGYRVICHRLRTYLVRVQ